MKRNLILIGLGCWIGLSGCGVFQPRKLESNFAQFTDVQCTSPEMIDGKISTGDRVVTFYSEKETGKRYGPTIVSLPERRRIQQIVIRCQNLKRPVFWYFDGEGKWVEFKRLRDNRSKTITINSAITTDQIKIMQRGTTGFVSRGHTPYQPQIMEIELYGLVE